MNLFNHPKLNPLWHTLDDPIACRRLFIVMWVIASVSLFLALHFPYRGEEAVYTISSIEMQFHHQFLMPTIYGILYWRPPLFNWLIIVIADVIGWSHVLIASRLVTITATALTGVVLWTLSQRLFSNEKNFALFVVLIYFTGDLMFRRSWIAYADPTFAFFTFTAMACLWLATHEKRASLFIPAAVAIIAAFLTKAMTVYVFYGVVGLILLASSRNRRILFHPLSIVCHIAALAFPFVWFHLVPNMHHGGGMLADMWARFSAGRWQDYAEGLFTKSYVYILRFFPISFLVIYCLVARKIKAPDNFDKRIIYTILAAVAINLIPYYFAPMAWQIRYLLPLFPFIAILFAYALWNSGQVMFRLTVVVLLAGLFLKCFVAPVGLPWFENMSYSYYPNMARDIMRHTKGYPLYATFHERVVTIIDSQRYPNAPIEKPPAHWNNGFELVYRPNPKLGKLIKAYRNKHHETVYVVCRGQACQVPW